MATVNENGFVLTHSNGVAIISAKIVGNNQVSDVCAITVNKYTETPNLIKKRNKIGDNITIYPNPTSTGQVIVNFNSNTKIATAKIYNSLGQIEKVGVIVKYGNLKLSQIFFTSFLQLSIS